MKIDRIGTGTRTGIREKKAAVKGNVFHTLLKSSLGEIDVYEQEGREQADKEKQPNRETVKLIGDAAHMLDRAMEQIHENGEPDSAVVKSLQRLSHRLDQASKHIAPEERQIADVLVAVETQRLRYW